MPRTSSRPTNKARAWQIRKKPVALATGFFRAQRPGASEGDDAARSPGRTEMGTNRKRGLERHDAEHRYGNAPPVSRHQAAWTSRRLKTGRCPGWGAQCSCPACRGCDKTATGAKRRRAPLPGPCLVRLVWRFMGSEEGMKKEGRYDVKAVYWPSSWRSQLLMAGVGSLMPRHLPCTASYSGSR